MNCSLKSDRHRFSPYRCVHIEVFHLIRRTATICLSHDRDVSPSVAHNLAKYGDGVANLCHCLRLPSLLSLLEFLDTLGVLGWQVSRLVFSYLHPELHLFAILENSTLCRDWSLASGFPELDQSVRQGALSISGLFDAIGFCKVEELVETERARFIVVDFDFATILLSPSCSCILFAIILVKLVKLKF